MEDEIVINGVKLDSAQKNMVIDCLLDKHAKTRTILDTIGDVFLGRVIAVGLNDLEDILSFCKEIQIDEDGTVQ